jgi:hypothetical protein
MNNKPTIYCVIGVIGSGKNYLCDKLSKHIITDNQITIHFADSLREKIERIFQCGIESSGGPVWENFKQTEIIHMPVSPTLHGRDFAVQFATILKEADPHIFINHTINKIRNLLDTDTHVFIPDLRFIEEFSRIYDFQQASGCELKILFTNYKSERYNNTRNSKEEYLAQFLTIYAEKYFPNHSGVDLYLYNSYDRRWYENALLWILIILNKNREYLEQQPTKEIVDDFVIRFM